MRPSDAAKLRDIADDPFREFDARCQSPNGSEDRWDVVLTMHAMDTAFGASFSEWIRDESNFPSVVVALRRILDDYDLLRLAEGLLWITQAWSVASVADLLSVCLLHWSNERKAMLVSLVTASWALFPDTFVVVRKLVASLSAPDAARFVSLVTEEWDTVAVHELCELLRQDLAWSIGYRNSFFTRLFLRLPSTLSASVSVPCADKRETETQWSVPPSPTALSCISEETFQPPTPTPTAEAARTLVIVEQCERPLLSDASTSLVDDSVLTVSSHHGTDAGGALQSSSSCSIGAAPKSATSGLRCAFSMNSTRSDTTTVQTEAAAS